jgi:hypothetical protein
MAWMMGTFMTDIWPLDSRIFDRCCGERPGVLAYADKDGVRKWRVMCRSCGNSAERQNPADAMVEWNTRQRGVKG